MDSDHLDTIVGQIYDAAIDPGLWPETLSAVRDVFGAAYVMASNADMTSAVKNVPPNMVRRASPWDEIWFEKLGPMLHLIPGIDALMRLDIDSAWTQLSAVSGEALRESRFYREWIAPQGLHDCINVHYLRRNMTSGVFSITKSHGDGVFTSRDCKIAETLAPHIRRAMAINDIVDKGRLASALYRSMLDKLAAAVFVVGIGGVLRFANAAGEEMLSNAAHLKKINGGLSAARQGHARVKLAEAIARALSGDASLGIRGIGVPLMSEDGEPAAAYVLPIAGGDLRRDVGNGNAIVFVSKRTDQQPVVIEILRTMFALTPTEARAAHDLVAGNKPSAIAVTSGVSPDTIRVHLKHVYAKTGVGDQVALAALINALTPPITANP